MANLKELRDRIGSVKNTRKITQAMSRISSARLRRAQNTMLDARPYGERMERIVGELIGEIDDPNNAHELLARREVKRVALVLVTADKGLCGGFNTNPSREAVNWIHEQEDQGREVRTISVGRKGATFVVYRKLEVHETHPAPEVDTVLDSARDLAHELIHAFTSADHDERVDEVHIIYNYFKNVLTQEVTTKQLLPVPGILDEEVESQRSAERGFEPGAKELLDHLLPVAVESTIQQVFFNSVAAEIAARRQAMDSATDNATELIGDLTLEYNRERQAAITTELMEIIGGAEALKG
jgi:F-type H+-transporting ATPase subunit gamma